MAKSVKILLDFGQIFLEVNFAGIFRELSRSLHAASRDHQGIGTSSGGRCMRPDAPFLAHAASLGRRRFPQPLFCFLKSELRILTTFYLAKNDHRWVMFISLKTIESDSG